MGDKKVVVVIDPMGNTKVEAIGFNGVGCEAATKPIEEALAGAVGMTRVLKPEWTNSADAQEDNHEVQW